MRALFLAVVLGIATLGVMAVNPSRAQAQGGPGYYSNTYPVRYWRGGSRWRGGSHYYYPRYYGGYYRGYYPGYYGGYYPGYYRPYYYPGYSNYYSPGYPSYYPGYMYYGNYGRGYYPY